MATILYMVAIWTLLKDWNFKDNKLSEHCLCSAPVFSNQSSAAVLKAIATYLPDNM